LSRKACKESLSGAKRGRLSRGLLSVDPALNRPQEIWSPLDLIQDNRCRCRADQSVGISERSVQNHAIVQREIACFPVFPDKILGKRGFPHLSCPGEKHDWEVLKGV
jgi:hypothetical protein